MVYIIQNPGGRGKGGGREAPREGGRKETMKKVIITVVGKDAIGIIAKVCTYMAGNKINILDISQTITGGFFNMMMVADFTLTEKDFDTIAHELEQIGEETGVIIRCQREEIFDRMHRL